MSDGSATATQAGEDRADATQRQRGAAVPGRCAAASIIISLLIMVGADLLRLSWQPQALPLPKVGPPWELVAKVPAHAVVAALWIGVLLAAAGIITGMVAARRGQPVPLRTILIAAAVIGVALVLLPPVGSTDSLDYAVYGHIAALGRSPYVMTPEQYRHLTHLRYSAPLDYAGDPSYYGPLATGEQLLAAKLAGSSLARTVLWLKVFNALAFAAVAIIIDRRFRAERAARLRAHLLWTVNPLLIWTLIAAGHLDVLAAAPGVAGLLLADRLNASDAAGRRALAGAAAAGVLAGAAADIKVDYILFVLAVGWALRRRPGQLLAAGSGAAFVLLVSYAFTGLVAIKALTGRVSQGQSWEYYGTILHQLGLSLHLAVPIAVILMFPMALLAMARMPDGYVVPSAVRAGLALSLAWLLLWPHQYAWYSVMIISALAFYPRSRLDWLSLAAFAAISVASVPGVSLDNSRVLGHAYRDIDYQLQGHLSPLVLLGVVIAFVIFCINQRWHARQDAVAPGA
jgi:hypothetical protein